MSRKMLVLLNHSLSEDQVYDAKVSLGVDEISYAPKDILECWGNISPTMSMWELREYIQPVFDWLRSVIKPNDILLIQGEATATFQVVTAIRQAFVMENIRCVSATTERVVEEQHQPDGSIQKKSVFRHVRYRAYFA
jgi:hypothetical protein